MILEAFQTAPLGESWISVHESVTTDEDGRWSAETAPARLSGRAIGSNVSHPDYPQPDVRYDDTVVPAELQAKTAVLVLRKDRTPRATVSGRVLDPGGRPIQGADVRAGWEHGSYMGLQMSEAEHLRAEPVQTDEEGRFRLENVSISQLGQIVVGRDPAIPRDSIILTVQAEGYAPDTRTIPMGPQSTVEFRLEPGHILRGRVVDPAGNPLEGVAMDASAWREQRALYWRETSEEDGRFVWREAPADEVEIEFKLPGFMEHRAKLSARDAEHVITLTPHLIVRGMVRDARTGRLLPQFEVTPGRPLSKTQMLLGCDGEYQYKWSYPQDRYALLFEAPGYRVHDSREFAATEGEVEYDVQLEPAPSVAGSVRTADGQPAAGARVFVAPEGVNVQLRDGELDRSWPGHEQQPESVVADTEGRFQMSAQRDPGMVAILHESGYAQASGFSLKEGSPIVLKPWGRVEGVLWRGAQRRADTDVLVFSNTGTTKQSPISNEFLTRTDAAGRFVFERVAPGWIMLGPATIVYDRPSIAYRVSHPALEHGQVLRYELGAGGRLVVGRIVTPAEITLDLARYWDNARVFRVETPREVLGQGPEAVRAWKEAWKKSAAGKEYEESPTDFRGSLSPAGEFRFEDIPPGKWALRVPFYDLPRPGTTEPGLAFFTYAFEVREPPAGHDYEAVDLGTVELKLEYR